LKLQSIEQLLEREEWPVYHTKLQEEWLVNYSELELNSLLDYEWSSSLGSQ